MSSGFGWAVAAAGACITVVNMVLALRKNVLGKGASGIPILGWWLGVLPFISILKGPFTGNRWLDLALVAVAHTTCSFVIPRVHGKLVRRAGRHRGPGH